MIIRTIKSAGDYAQISKAALEDNRISFKAKGLLCYLLSKSDEWTAVHAHLKTVGPDGADSTRSAMKELIDHGYLRQINITRPTGKFFDSWESIVFENPALSEGIENKALMSRQSFDWLVESRVERTSP